MTETDVPAGGARAPIRAGARRRALPARCYACDAPVMGPYCCACGQRNDDGRRSILALMAEGLRDVTALDGRLAQTLRAVVLRPGRFVRAYGDGARSPYTSPIRLFLVVSFAFFTTLWLSGRQVMVVQPVVTLDEAGGLALEEVAGGFFVRPIEVSYPPAIRAEMRQAIVSGEPGATQAASPAGGGSVNWNGQELRRDRLEDALFRAAENPRLFNNALDDWIPRIMLMMVPLMALCGAVFVRGRDALLYDHALLSLNTHAVAFGLMTLGLWTSALVPGWLLAGAVLLGVPIYYARGLRGAFGRSRRKTVVATGFVFAVYGLVLFVALTAAAVGAFGDTI